MRITIISTSKLRTYKISAISLFAFIVMVVLIAAFQGGGIFWPLSATVFYGYLGFLAIRQVISIKNVSFDDGSVYYERSDYEVQIPFSEIRNIEIMSLDGIYKINLYQPNQDGKVIRFKTSLWYPLNFRRQDEKVQQLREKIDRYKRNMRANRFEELPGRRI